MDLNPNVRRYIYIIGAALGIVILGVIMVIGFQQVNKTALDIQSVVPDDIAVTVDGVKVASSGTVSTKPGQHTVTAKRSGFADQTQTVTLLQNEVKAIRWLLVPNSQEGYDWVKKHVTGSSDFEAKAGQAFDQTSQDLTQKYPIIASLPEIHPRWRIDYGKSVAHPNDPNALAIIITYGGSDVDKQNALNWMKQQSYNPSDYEIIYKLPSATGN